MPSYLTLLKTFLAELQQTEQFKRDMLIKLARQLEKENYPTNQINDRIADDVKGYITRQYVGQVLESKYKDTSKIHKKSEKEQVIELAADGTIIERRDKDELEKEEDDKFSELLDQKAQKASAEIQSLDKAVLQELDKALEDKKQLQDQLIEWRKKTDKFQELMDEIANYFNEFIMINEEYEVVEVLSTKTPNEIKIDLRKFEDSIKDSYKRGKYSAVVRHDGEKVTKWT